MGFNYSGIKLLLYAKSKGVDFKKTLTIGRQGLHLDLEYLKQTLDQFGLSNISAKEIFEKNNGYAELFLQALGAEVTDSLDASNYEHPTLIHDMNLPIGEQLKGKYSVVIDGGSLEHIFNFPVAIKNCMEMIAENGYYLGITPCNNLFGHGFYQFSPELYFRIFSKENGFDISSVIFYNYKTNSKWYEVKDPNEVKARVMLSNNCPSYLFILAKKVETIKIFSTFPQQSDYQNISWKCNVPCPRAPVFQQKTAYLRKLKTILKNILIRPKDFGDGNPHYFQEITFK